MRTSELDGVVQAIGSFFKRWKSRGGEKQLLSRYESTEQAVLRKDGLRFFFFSREGTEPRHVHVEQPERYGKFWLEPVVLLSAFWLEDDQ